MRGLTGVAGWLTNHQDRPSAAGSCGSGPLDATASPLRSALPQGVGRELGQLSGNEAIGSAQAAGMQR